MYYTGEGEQARVLKLAINAMLAATAEMLAEVVTLCEASGIDRALALDVVIGSIIGSPFVKYKRDALVNRHCDATFTTAMMLKDLQLTQGAAADQALELPVARLVTELALATCQEGLVT